MIDEHVHCRDGNQKNKETVEHALRVAFDSGLDAIFDIANTDEPVVDLASAEKRLDLASRVNSPVIYGLYILVTPEPEQIAEAVEASRKYALKDALSRGERVGVVGLKGFMGKSVGNTSVIGEDNQRKLYRTLAKLKYRGVLAEHCEDESELKPKLWTPESPISHCAARPRNAEIVSVRNNIRYTKEEGFAVDFGRIHVFHVSTPESVELVNEARKYINISCEVTFNHLLLNNLTMEREDGIMWKVNPPLRGNLTRIELLDCFIRGSINTLASDHAPHTYNEKTGRVLDAEGKPIYLSGIPGLASIPEQIVYLGRLGVKRKLIERTTHDNINRIFDLEIPRSGRPTKSGLHVHEYAFDPCKYLTAA